MIVKSARRGRLEPVYGMKPGWHDQFEMAPKIYRVRQDAGLPRENAAAKSEKSEILALLIGEASKLWAGYDRWA